MLAVPRSLRRHIRCEQRRNVWEWAAANSDVAALSAAAMVMATARMVQLEVRTRTQAAMAAQQAEREESISKEMAQVEADLQQTRERERALELQARGQAATADAQAKRLTELSSKLQEARANERRLQSITERGQRGEQGLEHLLMEMVSCSYAESYSLQPEIATGKRPDAVVTLAGGARLVVDSKAPRPPTRLLETACEDERRQYVATLKRHISELGSKRYHAVEGVLSRTWLLLPGEGYLQAAYATDGRDSARLHEHAAERAVMLVGPNGLRSALQLLTLLQQEAEASRRLEDSHVQQRLRELQPIWTERVLPRSRAMGKDLKKVVATFNELADLIITFDAELRATDVLDLPKARRTSLPSVVGEPCETPVETRSPRARQQAVAVTHRLATADGTDGTSMQSNG